MAMVARGYRGDAETLHRFHRPAPRRPGRRVGCLAIDRRRRSLDDHAPRPLNSTSPRRHPTRYLDRFPALDEVSLTVRRGERVALLGANGCGKSTLLQAPGRAGLPGLRRVHGVRHPVTEDTLEDEQFSQAFRSRVGFVFQNSDAQVFSPTRPRGGRLRPAAARSDARAGRDRASRTRSAMLGIADLADRAPFQLSGGAEEARRHRRSAGHEPRGAALRRADRGPRPADPAVADRADRSSSTRPARPSCTPPTTWTPSTARRPLRRLLRAPHDRRRGHPRRDPRRPRPAAVGQPHPLPVAAAALSAQAGSARSDSATAVRA